MADIGAMRAAIKTRLEAAGIPGLQVLDHWPNSLTMPRGHCAVIIKPASGSHDQSFGAYPFDRTEIRWELHLFVGTEGGIPNAEEILDKYLSNEGPHSLRQGIAGDRRFGGQVDFTQLVGWHDYDLKEWPDQKTYMGAILDLRSDVR